MLNTHIQIILLDMRSLFFSVVEMQGERTHGVVVVERAVRDLIAEHIKHGADDKII